MVGFAILSVLAGLFFVLIRLDPRARFEQIRNAGRMADVVRIADAIKNAQSENGGYFPEFIEYLDENTAYQIGTGNDCDDPCFYPTVELRKECVDLSVIVRETTADPRIEGAIQGHSGYYLVKHSDGQLVVGACREEKGASLLAEPEEISVIQ